MTDSDADSEGEVEEEEIDDPLKGLTKEDINLETLQELIEREDVGFLNKGLYKRKEREGKEEGARR
ncbi:MAG: hypothetical protein GWO20_06380 [Candidatus Korarchaeota archaeon]|nr:hypothetical protein [Candidatus Korarchaeota archaeon]NIU85295.1 hypothetical protein [Candidatus Thorarchaeota archaeon]NIW15394.1 hypothetical protein [Candidatus Thorarchaeota archaeon]NIW53339.1 hypothetical protein [Candidatus Korarchaeota archaeon]